MGSTESIKSAVEAGTGIAILSRWAVKKEVEDGRLKAVNFKEDSFTRDLTLIYLKKSLLSHADKELLHFIKNYSYDMF